MNTPQTHAQKTSADKKAIGFEYQYWFFLWKVLQLKSGQSVGMEVADDVHTELTSDQQILFQLKHTLAKKADGTPGNLTRYDQDLWKTMSNWSKIIQDVAAGRSTELEQLEFVKKTDFVLVSNKSDSNDPEISELLSNPPSGRKLLEGLRNGTDSGTLKEFFKDILSMEESVFRAFLSKVSLVLELDDLIDRCKTVLIEKQLPENRIDELLRNLDSNIRQDNFLEIKSGRKVVITFSEFTRKYRAHFDDARSIRLKIRQEYDPLPISLDRQTFICQLVDIGDIVANDLNQMAEYTIFMKSTEKNLLRWQLEGELTGIQANEFELDAKTAWANSYREKHRASEQSSNERALKVVDDLRRANLSLGGQLMGIRFSNGLFYRLADMPQIGFSPDWQQKYQVAGKLP